jgi:hypothetical protein
LTGDKIGIHTIAGPSTNIDHIETVVDEAAGRGKLGEDQLRRIESGGEA